MRELDVHFKRPVQRVNLRPDLDTNHGNREAIHVTKDSDELLYCFLDDVHRDRSHYTHWYREFVSANPNCHLTKPHDELPALALIAAAVSGVVQDTHVAGHWRGDFELSLL